MACEVGFVSELGRRMRGEGCWFGETSWNSSTMDMIASITHHITSPPFVKHPLPPPFPFQTTNPPRPLHK